MVHLTECIIESVVLDRLKTMERKPFFGPEIVPGMQAGVLDAELHGGGEAF